MVRTLLGPVSQLAGVVEVPGDKSIAHRALLCGALSDGASTIANVPDNADVAATIRAIEVCGATVRRNSKHELAVRGPGSNGWTRAIPTIDCMNSGTTMRLLMGVLAGQRVAARLVGDRSLSQRPMLRVVEPLRRMGADISLDGDRAPIRLRAGTGLRGISYSLNVASAQVKSALLFAGLAADGRTTLSGRLDSRDHTERMLPRFGVELDRREETLRIEGGQRLRATHIDVPGDSSSAAVWIAAAVVTRCSRVTLPSVCLNPTRCGFIDVLRAMGASIETTVRSTEPEPIGDIVASSSSLRGVEIGADTTPFLADELPLVAVIATQAHGRTIVRGAGELRVKESDRIEAIAGVLRRMGAVLETFDDGFCIDGPQELFGAALDPCGDHRIAMAAAIAAIVARGPTEIHNMECVNVSYPAFVDALLSLGRQP